ncbi:MAG: sigma-54-dependent Fis family transcriptional regulator [Deltaproteobacteria bacterium]|nr:sigma-54-dependent Fis family transcriptional regulator [Deltaproteobacteria bacterium]
MKDFEILFVDDKRETLSLVDEYLSYHGYRITIVDSGLKAFELVKERDFDIVLTDLRMPGFSGLELLTAIKKYRSEIEVIIITGYGSIESAVEALKLGCYDYIQKPIKFERLKMLIDRIIEKKKLERENTLLKRRLEERSQYYELIGASHGMQKLYDLIDRISSNSSTTIMIQGESGTGKELVARIIHKKSDRADKPFISVNCGAIVEGLLESELFGHVNGAFTGAVRDRIGLFKAAEGGTIFLDEITETIPLLQVKLLRVLQEKKVRPVGDTKELEIDVRVIAASNNDLDEAVKSGILRKDLFYRLNVVSVKISPLSERKKDIPLLVNHFIDKFNSRGKRRIVSISPEGMDIMLNYNWPGNVRQLENAIERAFALGADEVIEAADLPSEIKRFGETLKTEKPAYALRENETILIKKALDKTDGNKAIAADLLGINITTLYRKIKKNKEI